MKYDAQDLRHGMTIRGVFNGIPFQGRIKYRLSLSHTQMAYYLDLDSRVIIADTKDEVNNFLGNSIQVLANNGIEWFNTTVSV